MYTFLYREQQPASPSKAKVSKLSEEHRNLQVGASRNF